MQSNNQTAFRSVVSPFVAILFLGVGVSGILMLLHVRSGGLRALHEWMGIVMVLGVILHLIINWRIFVSLFRYKLAIVAAVVAAVLLGGTLVAGSVGGPKGGRPHGGPPCVSVTPPAGTK